jgi:hypothetical protein
MTVKLLLPLGANLENCIPRWPLCAIASRMQHAVCAMQHWVLRYNRQDNNKQDTTGKIHTWWAAMLWLHTQSQQQQCHFTTTTGLCDFSEAAGAAAAAAAAAANITSIDVQLAGAASALVHGLHTCQALARHAAVLGGGRPHLIRAPGAALLRCSSCDIIITPRATAN